MNRVLPELKVVCAWCGAHMEGNPEAERISHGICADCFAKEEKRIDDQQGGKS